jgi:hypothetical protein
MKMKAKRKAERDRARRNTSTRLRQAPPVEGERTCTDVSDDIDLRIDRSLRGYDE